VCSFCPFSLSVYNVLLLSVWQNKDN